MQAAAALVRFVWRLRPPSERWCSGGGGVSSAVERSDKSRLLPCKRQPLRLLRIDRAQQCFPLHTPIDSALWVLKAIILPAIQAEF